MIGFLEGRLLEKTPGQILLQVGGVGYQVFISLTTFYALPEPPAQVALHIHTRLQEEALNLYGFADPEEKELFLQLLGIPRVGARMALNILSGVGPEEFRQALAAGDVRRLAAIPGVGKKSAERILLELKDKAPPAPRGRPRPAPDQAREDALSALLNLGYQRNVADKALDTAQAQGARTLEDLLRQALKWLAK
ncbi:MAG: Holliday junction branch migration protein RuvA [Syntrophobacterales bacterium]|nr:Holliday junction branch migration protein RuvA [Syntrophobacterales bacterium]